MNPIRATTRRSVAALGLAVSIAAVGVASGQASPLSPAGLTSELLRASQVPSGWSVGDDGGFDGIGCLRAPLSPAGVHEDYRAQVLYVGSGDLPAFVEMAGTYSDAGVAFQRITARVDACHRLTGETPGGVEITGRVAEASLPRVGKASASYTATINVLGLIVRSDYVIVRKGNVIAAILEGNSPAVSTRQFDALVAKAVARLS